MPTLGLDLRWYALALILSLLVGRLRPDTGEIPRIPPPWALALGFVLYVVLVLVTWARGEPVRAKRA